MPSTRFEIRLSEEDQERIDEIRSEWVKANPKSVPGDWKTSMIIRQALRYLCHSCKGNPVY